MFKFLVLAVAVAVASASLEADWAIFKNKHGKKYSAEEEVVRRYVWQINMKKVEEHNELFAQGKSTYYLGENEYADMTAEEIVHQMNGFRPKGKLNPGNFTSGKLRATLPDSVDWRTKGYVTEVKNQGNCGSCWAFSTTGSLEGQHFKSTGTLVSLSESNLVDCSQRFGNHGCQGGLMDDAFRYIISNKGIDTEQSYPYMPENRPCKFQKNNVGSTENAYKDVESGSEDALQQAVATIGPISVAIDASKSSFHLYKGGVYNEPLCSSTRLDHGVLAVGYGSENGQDYWLVKNSWGASWGQQGYIMMSRNKNNQCGIATIASYPIV